jgi:hypothetical protein
MHWTWPMNEPSLGEQYDQIAGRLDAAYNARRNCRWGTDEYAEATEELDRVFADLRVLNEIAWRSIGGRPGATKS